MLITNFASGELSQNLNGRVDIQQYYQGAAKIENFEIIPTGGIKRRVGTKRVAELSGNSRIIPFIVNKNSVYVLELGVTSTTRTLASLEETGTNGEYAIYNSKLYKYVTSAWVQIAAGKIAVWQRSALGVYSVVQLLDNIPWGSLAEIRELQYTQNYDTIVFCHKNYRPYIMQLVAGVFNASEMEFDFSADVELDDDFDYVMVVAGTNFPTKETTADGHGRFTYKRLINGVPTDYTQDFGSGINDFYCIKDGKLYKWNVNQFVVYGTDYEAETGLFTTGTKYPSCVSFFNNRLFFASTIHKPQMVWASAAPDNYGTRYNDFSTYKKYVTVNKVVKDADLHIFTCNISQSDIDTVQHRTVLRSVTQNFTIPGALKTDLGKYYVSGGVIPIGTRIISVTSDTITIDTSDVSIAFTEGHTTETNIVMSIQLWRTMDNASAEDYEYMVVANNITTADCSLFFELASDQNDSIKFLSSNNFLAIGTESSIWSVDAGINALNVSAAMQGRYGSDSLQGQAVETATVYFAQGNKGIREFYYDGEAKAFRTNNIALLADHILRESAVIDFDYMTNPYSRLMVVRDDGLCAVMLYDKTNGIMAWSRIILGNGKIKNCAVTRGEDENDLVFFVVQSGTGAGARYFLEVYDLGSSTYLDSWKVYDTTAQTPADGYTTGAIIWNKTTDQTCPYDNIPTGFINAGDELFIGYDYTSYIKSMPVVAGELSAQKRIVRLFVYFLESWLPVVKVTGRPYEKFTTITQTPYSGVGKVNYPGTTDRDVCFELETNGAKAVNILSVEAQLA
jgi:hypothetical protein